MEGVLAPGPRLSLAPEILIRDDATRLSSRDHWPSFGLDDRLRLLREAVDLFRYGQITVTGADTQGPAEFATAMHAIAGLPPTLVDRWCSMLRGHLDRLDWLAPKRPDGALALVSLPSNTFTCLEAVLEATMSSAAVWIRPSRREPLSSARLLGALIQVGWPTERLGFYPSTPEVLPALLQVTDRQVVYGGDGVVAHVTGDGGLDLRGPGQGRVIVDEKSLASPDLLAARLADLVASNAGRFCTNIRTIACLGNPLPLAEKLAEVLDGISLSPPDSRWPQACCAQSDGRRIVAQLERLLLPGSRVMTRRPPLLEADGSAFLTPTLVYIDNPHHPLAGWEPPFALATILAIDPAALKTCTSPTRAYPFAR